MFSSSIGKLGSHLSSVRAVEIYFAATALFGAAPLAVAQATHFAVSAPAAATGNVAFTFTVTALDALNNTVTTYAGTVHFTSTDPSATLPANSTLSNGTGTFSATLRTVAGRTITATDTISPSITGTSNEIVVTVLPATHFSITAPASATAGLAFSFTVTALDELNNTVTAFVDIVHFTSSDGQAVLPADSTLTNGAGTFSATLKTAGIQTIAATGTVTSSIVGNVTVTVPGESVLDVPALDSIGIVILIVLLSAAGFVALRFSRPS